MTCNGIAGTLPIALGICIAVNLTLNGNIEFILIPRFKSTISAFGKETLSITFVVIGLLLFIVTVATSL